MVANMGIHIDWFAQLRKADAGYPVNLSPPEPCY